MSDEIISKNISPFLKWAGGKRWFVGKHIDECPSKYKRYIEPFLGGGSLFFKISPKSAILSDINVNLIETYCCIRDDWESVLELLQNHHYAHSEEHYYRVRALVPETPIERAARFIYLNRTCWNALYRVNLNGQFNVPIGTKKNVIYPDDDFKAVSEVLKSCEIVKKDFESVIDLSERGDFIFIDPPYTVKHNNNGFVKYNEKMFTWDDQVRLRDCVIRAHCRGSKIMITNACHESVLDLYRIKGFSTKILTRSSAIAGRKEDRNQKYEEILVKNF